MQTAVWPNRISSGFPAGFASTGGAEHLRNKSCLCRLFIICLPFSDFSFSQYICSISFSGANCLYSIILVRFANNIYWQSYFLFVHYGPQYPANIWRTGLQKSYTRTLQSRTSHHLHSQHIMANQASIIIAGWSLKWMIIRNTFQKFTC